MNNFIDDLNALDSIDPNDLGMPDMDAPYEAAGGGKDYSTPPPGRYTLRLPQDVEWRLWPKSEKGPANFEISFKTCEIVAPGTKHDGKEIRYVTVNTRLIAGVNASSATDLLQRAGMEIPKSARGWAEAATALAGAQIEDVYCDWECRAPSKGPVPERLRLFLRQAGATVTDPKARKTLIRGAKNFPKGPDGQPLTKMTVSVDGEEVNLYANLKPTWRGFGLTKEEMAVR